VKISLNWLKDYVDIVPTPEQLAERLTLSGTMVEGIQKIGVGWDDILTAEIVRLAPHPNADRLQQCTVSLGDREQTVLTGAFNIAVGDKVPFIGLGGRLPDGTVLEARPMRGIVSEGMVLAEDELGIGDDHAGIMILDPATRPGLPLASVLGDVVLDLEITPNRPDCLSYIGVAREVAALTGQTLRLPTVELDEYEPPVSHIASVRVEAPDLCPRYMGRAVSGVQVGPSPAWMAARLRASGMRSINNIVDVSNYVMLEWGQPLHTFDLQAVVAGGIVVRRAEDGETIETLDGQTRTLHHDMLVIADTDRAVAIAGVMGGANSEIGPQTHTVLIESATFAPRTVRRTTQELGLRSEASSRFEKGLPWTLPPQALDRAAALLVQVGGGVVHAGVLDAATPAPAQVTVELPQNEVARLLGVDLTGQQVVDSLRPLGFAVAAGAAEGALIVSVPAWRGDVGEAADLVEEVARMLGFDAIPVTMPRGVVSVPPPSPARLWDQRIRSFLLGCGLTDTATYSLISAAALSALFAHQEEKAHPTPERVAALVPNPEGVSAHGAEFRLLRLVNPLSPETEYLRPTLLPGLVATLRTNLKHTTEELAFFELTHCFFPRPGDLPYERRTLGLAMTGLRDPLGWATASAEVDFYDLKGVVEELLGHCGLGGYRFERGAHPALHPGRAARLLAADGQELGYLGELHPALAPLLDLGERRVYLAELDADLLISLAAPGRTARPISRYPVVKRDIAVVLPDAVEAATLVATVRAAGGDLLDDVRIFDVYHGEQVPPGHKSVACALTLQASDRTLSDKEAAAAFSRISGALAAVGGQVRDAS